MVGSKSDCPWLLLRLLVVLLVAASGSAPVAEAEPAFDENYAVQWGADGYHLVIRGTEVNITMDQNSGTYNGLSSVHMSCCFVAHACNVKRA
jgi:xyloglucan:xyloglucosyl transferase